MVYALYILYGVKLYIYIISDHKIDKQRFLSLTKSEVESIIPAELNDCIDLFQLKYATFQSLILKNESLKSIQNSALTNNDQSTEISDSINHDQSIENSASTNNNSLTQSSESESLENDNNIDDQTGEPLNDITNQDVNNTSSSHSDISSKNYTNLAEQLLSYQTFYDDSKYYY